MTVALAFAKRPEIYGVDFIKFLMIFRAYKNNLSNIIYKNWHQSASMPKSCGFRTHARAAHAWIWINVLNMSISFSSIIPTSRLFQEIAININVRGSIL